MNLQALRQRRLPLLATAAVLAIAALATGASLAYGSAERVPVIALERVEIVAKRPAPELVQLERVEIVAKRSDRPVRLAADL